MNKPKLIFGGMKRLSHIRHRSRRGGSYSESSMKCLHCKKDKGSHNGRTNACPIGQRHRTVGYTQYHSTNVYTPNPRPKPRKPKPPEFTL